MKRLNVTLDDELHKNLKVAVATKATTIGNYVAEAIAEKLEREQKGSEDKKE